MTAVGTLGMQVFSRFFIQEVTLVESPSFSTLLLLPICTRIALTLREVLMTMLLAREGVLASLAGHLKPHSFSSINTCSPN